MRMLLERVIFVLVTPFAYALLYILVFADTIAFWLDRRLHTQLRTPKITVEEVQFLVETYIQSGSTNEDVFTDCPKDVKQLPLKNHELESDSESIKGVVSAKVENVGKSYLVKHDILIFFYYDQQNKLFRYVTEGAATGL
jgi:hypothetical protein